MKSFLTRYWPPLVVGIVVLATTLIALHPYGFNPTSAFHMDATLAGRHPMPENFVVLRVPAYDGAGYYQIARSIPQVFTPSAWPELASQPPSSYAYQRFLLPLTAWIMSLGQEAALPWAFLLINIASLIGASWIMLRATRRPLYALAIGLCPAAMVGIHFSLAEPLNLLLLTAFFARYLREEKLDTVSILLLCVLTLSREVNILFAGLLGVYTLFRCRWKDCFKLLLPLASFVALHGLIYAIFSEFPFLESADKRDFPGYAIMELVLGWVGYDMYTLSSIALFLGFVLPGTIWALRQNIIMVRMRTWAFLPIGTLAFFLLMFNMPDHIWSSITSIGRVITPIYPLALFLAASQDTKPARLLAVAIIALGLGAGLGLAVIPHPFELA